jgi:sugar/nucleoside kinase (ribokinase family)
LYAGGFLYGLANDLSLPNCGNIGSLLSGKVVEVIGAKIPDNVWKEIHSSIKSMNG